MRRFISISAILMVFGIVDAEVVPSKLISDGMVVQRDRPVLLWGAASPGESINVSAKGPDYNADAQTTADSKGNWSVQLTQMPAGEGYTISINNLMIDNVASGDVILCAGQSNMELPVNRVTDMFGDEIASYANRQVRHFKVPQEVEFHQPRTSLNGGKWVETTPAAAMDFTALGYFLGKELNHLENIPVGIINASWGGTPIEAWMSKDALLPWPQNISEWRVYQDDGYRQRIKKLEEENYSRWNAALYAGDPGRKASKPWYSDDYSDLGWTEVDMFSDVWSSDGYNPYNGSHWFRKNVKISAEDAGKEATLRLGCIVDADSVYVNGRFVGTTSYQYPPRIYKVPAGVLREGNNNVTVRLISQNGKPHFVEEKPYRLIVGTNEYDLQGKWKYNRGAVMPQGPSMAFFQYSPMVLYNGMISPLCEIPLAGVVWYQGESNVGRRNLYPAQLQAMMADWRSSLGQPELQFYIVELANFLHPSDVGGRKAWQEMREDQKAAADGDSHATFISNYDLGEWNDIHPLDKKTLAERVAAAMTK